jgi:hypothetical protein
MPASHLLSTEWETVSPYCQELSALQGQPSHQPLPGGIPMLLWLIEPDVPGYPCKRTMSIILGYDGLNNIASENKDDVVLFHLDNLSLHCGFALPISMRYGACIWLQQQVALHNIALVHNHRQEKPALQAR